MWCSAADSRLRLLDNVVRCAGFLVSGILECNLAHRRSVAELCMLFKIKSNPLHPLSGAVPLPYVPAHVTRGALVAHRHSFAPPPCRTSQYHRTIVPLSVSLWNDLSDAVSDGVGLAGFKSSQCFPVSMICSFFFVSCYFIFFLLPWVGYVGLGVSPGLALRTPVNNNNNWCTVITKEMIKIILY